MHPTLKLNIDSKYRYIATEVLGRQQTFSYFGPKSLDQSPAREALIIPVEKGAAELVLSRELGWFHGQISRCVIPTASSDRAKFETDGQHTVWRVPTPKDWRLVAVRGSSFTGPACRHRRRQHDQMRPLRINALPPYYVQVALKSDVTMDSFLGTPVDDRTPGVPMSILTMLTDNTPVLGADVSAAVENPFGTVVAIKLWDDGNHGDGGANDGLYANTFYQTGFIGNYNVTINAAGVGSIAGPFEPPRSALVQHLLDQGESGRGRRRHSRRLGTTLLRGPSSLRSQGRSRSRRCADCHRVAEGHRSHGPGHGRRRRSRTARIQTRWSQATIGSIRRASWCSLAISRVYIRWTPRPNYRFLDIFRGDNPDGPFEYVGDVDAEQSWTR